MSGLPTGTAKRPPCEDRPTGPRPAHTVRADTPRPLKRLVPALEPALQIGRGIGDHRGKARTGIVTQKPGGVERVRPMVRIDGQDMASGQVADAGVVGGKANGEAALKAAASASSEPMSSLARSQRGS